VDELEDYFITLVYIPAVLDLFFTDIPPRETVLLDWILLREDVLLY